MKLGILGGGQLARMLALAAYPLGIRTICIDPDPLACAREVTEVIQANFTDHSSLQKLLTEADVFTYETENIPLTCAEQVAVSRPLYPSVETLRIAQDRLHEKTFFQSLKILTPKFIAVDSEAALEQATAKLGFPAILKTRRMGYDGKGQFILKSSDSIAQAWATLNNSELILEEFVPFEFETSLISVRNSSGEIAFYPLVRNRHEQGILRESETPFVNTLQKQAEQYATRILENLNYIGVLAIEFFYDGQQLLANEMAPRVHNSGHWTIEGAQTSQFENHLRAIFNLPLGDVTVTHPVYMLNCIGEMPSIQSCLAISGAHYHTYGKAPKPNRKLGHVTLVNPNSENFTRGKTALQKLQSARVPG
jgi:5-(carboxyamino)imidazole ribonucleotide synthase